MKEVAEGVYTARAARELATELKLPPTELPIIYMVANIVDVRNFDLCTPRPVADPGFSFGRATSRRVRYTHFNP